MHDTILNILQWLIPSGGLGVAIGWLTSRTLRQARTSKEVHDAYRTMYEDVRATLIQLQDDNRELHLAVARLNKAVYATARCAYRVTCPVRHELRKQESKQVAGAGTNLSAGSRRPRDADLDGSGDSFRHGNIDLAGAEPP